MKSTQSEKIRQLTMTGMLTALTVVATLVIQIPTPTKGYIHLGDTIVNLSAWLLGPACGAAAAGLGSALADLIAGYSVYAPATLLIKAGMAAASWGVYQLLSRKKPSVPARIAAAVSAELVMLLGYAVFEGFLYHSFATALLSLSGNLIQGIFGAAASVALYELVIRHIPKMTQ